MNEWTAAWKARQLAEHLPRGLPGSTAEWTAAAGGEGGLRIGCLNELYFFNRYTFVIVELV